MPQERHFGNSLFADCAPISNLLTTQLPNRPSLQRKANWRQPQARQSRGHQRAKITDVMKMAQTPLQCHFHYSGFLKTPCSLSFLKFHSLHLCTALHCTCFISAVHFPETPSPVITRKTCCNCWEVTNVTMHLVRTPPGC